MTDLPQKVTQSREQLVAKPRRLPAGWTPASRRRLAAERRLAEENAQEAQERLDSLAAQLRQDSAGVRIAAVNALVLFADKDPARRQDCINTLCAALRETAAPGPDDDDRESGGDQWLAWAGDRACRYVILTAVAAHLRSDAAISWRGYDFDFSGVVFEGSRPQAGAADRMPSFVDAGLSAEVSFAGAQFTGGQVSFAGAQFTGGQVNFAGATFSGAKVSLLGADMTGGELSFAGAEFAQGKVSFCSRFLGGAVAFIGARFTGGSVGFLDAEFIGGGVDFLDAEFTGGEVSFVGAVFAGSEVNFVGAEFAGSTVSFAGAKFAKGRVSFVGTEFASGEVRFPWAEFSGSEVRFSGAKFDGGRVDFAQAKFAGSEIDFTSAQFSRGLVDISGATVWSVPPSFDQWASSPASLRLPAWYRPDRQSS